MRYLDQQAQAQWRHGQRSRQHSNWVIDTMRDALPPEHVALAERLAALQAVAEGVRQPDNERVDCSANRTEGALLARLEAQRIVCGFEAAVRKELHLPGQRCFTAIVFGDTLAGTRRRLGYDAGCDSKIRTLVQLTMIAAQDHQDAGGCHDAAFV